MVDRSAVLAAAETIGGRVRRTPIIDLDGTTLKLELLQHTGSFKPRGTFNKVLSAGVTPERLVAASGGNHGLAVAYAAQKLGVAADIFVPTISSAIKVAKLRTMGATVHVSGAVYADALVEADVWQAANGGLSIHAYDDPMVVAGQGTVAVELHQQDPDLDAVVVAVGGGGLAGGIAAYYADDVAIVAVETEHTNTYASAVAAGHPVTIEGIGGPSADSLGASSIGSLAFEVLQRYNVQSVVVPDQAVREAQRRLWSEFRLVAEPGGAVALAALISGAYVPGLAERIGAIVCGSNADPASVVR